VDKKTADHSRSYAPHKGKGKGKVKVIVYLLWNTISQLRSVTCHMGSHSVTCYPTQVNALRLHPSQSGRYSITRFTYPGGIEGWVDLGDLLHTEMVYPPAGGHLPKY